MMSDKWNTWKIDGIGRIVTGKTPPTQNLNNFGDRYPFITPRDMLGQKRIHKTERYLSEEGKNTVKNCLLPANSVCVSCIGSDMGKVVMTTTDSVTNQQLNSVICKASFDSDFVYYAVVNISDELRNVGHHSTAVPILNKTDFSNFEITAPDIVTQRRIGNILSALDEKIELNRQTNATLEAIAQAIFKEWFVDFNFPCGTDEMQDGELGPIPKGWRVFRLKEIVNQIKPGTNFQPKRIERGIPFLNIRNINKGFLDLNDVKYISIEDYNQVHKSWQPEQNDILISRIGTLGLVAIIRRQDMPVAVHYNFIDIKAKAISFEFLYFLLKSDFFQQQYHLIKKASVQEYVTIDEVEQLKIVLPVAFEDMKLFERPFRSILDHILILQEQNQTLMLIRDSLLPKLMIGEIEV